MNKPWVSTKCGEGDTDSGLVSCSMVGNFIDRVDLLGATTCFGETSEPTGTEKVCAARTVSPEIDEKFMKAWQAYVGEVIEPHKTSNLSDSQPTKGNIAGGLTTIEENAFGNLQKIGKKTRFIDMLRPAKAPGKGAGLYFMDTSPVAAAGCGRMRDIASDSRICCASFFFCGSGKYYRESD